jgi:hypothetical protein
LLLILSLTACTASAVKTVLVEKTMLVELGESSLLTHFNFTFLELRASTWTLSATFNCLLTIGGFAQQHFSVSEL